MGKKQEEKRRGLQPLHAEMLLQETRQATGDTAEAIGRAIGAVAHVLASPDATEADAEQLSAEVLPGLREQLRTLQDINSSYPATKEFLQARGLSNVRELDERGKEALKAFLEARLKSLMS